MRKYTKIIGISLLMFLLLNLLIACKEEAKNPMEVKHESILKEYDQTHKKRLKMFETDRVLRVYKMADAATGFIIASEGYEEEILVYAKLDEEDVREIEILYEVESEKYGEHVTERWFLNRLLLPIDVQLATVQFKKDKDNEVIAITGATITSEAVVIAINQCIEMKKELTN